MSDHSANEIKAHIKKYWVVFFALMVLTVVTVAVSRLHLAAAGALVLAMMIALAKGSLVASIFMHLKGEKVIILAILLLTVFFFFFLLLIPTFHHS